MDAFQWLHQVREKKKQRAIWGYKMLLLDMGFIFNLDRFIFLDTGKRTASQKWGSDSSCSYR
jgi:hypothetical protein